MRKKLTTLAILVSAFTLNSFAGNQLPDLPFTMSALSTENPTELIVTFENLTMKQYEDLDNALADIQGVKMVGYCQKQNCYYFNYDRTIYKTGDEAFEALAIKTKLYHPLMKTGVTIALIQTLCQQ
ncbi:MAG: hypothetical protein K0R65_2280 [Crocinitomicaceae bacterium]|jgi:hypothetical protein|nr:hypothetical protein [Crocinitomicaceae bacterium]